MLTEEFERITEHTFPLLSCVWLFLLEEVFALLWLRDKLNVNKSLCFLSEVCVGLSLPITGCIELTQG